MLYDVISLGNIRGECGWEVNDAHYTGHRIELPDRVTLVDIMKALKECGVMLRHVKRTQVYLDEEGGDSFYVRAKRTHEWLWELRLRNQK